MKQCTSCGVTYGDDAEVCVNEDCAAGQGIHPQNWTTESPAVGDATPITPAGAGELLTIDTLRELLSHFQGTNLVQCVDAAGDHFYLTTPPQIDVTPERALLFELVDANDGSDARPDDL